MNKNIQVYPTLITQDAVIIMKGGKRLIAPKNHPSFRQIIDRIKAKNYNGIERLFQIRETMEKCFDVTIKNGNQVFYKGEQLGNVLTDKILTFMREGLPHRPYVKFLNKLMQNPSVDSRNSLYAYLDLHKLPVTEDGDFIAVKAIRSDWTDKYSGQIKNVIGKPVRMPRDQVNKDNDECAGAGLHVGSDQYVNSYGGDGDIFILVKVNPKNVVVVPREGGYGKIRLCEYTPIRKINREDLSFTSDYAPNNPQYYAIRNERGQFKAKSNKGNNKSNKQAKLPKRDSKGRFV